YSIYSSLGFFDATGVCNISAGVETEKVEKAFHLIMRELQRATQHLPAPAELHRASDYVIGHLDLSLKNTESQMMWAVEQLLSYGKIFSPDEIKRHLLAVRASDIREVACDFFRSERMNLALVSPLKKATQLKCLLRN